MFNLGFSKNLIYVVLGIMVVMKFLSGGTEAILLILLTIPAVLIALTFHEFAHAYIAYKLGDDTAKLEGRISLNPLKHIDPIGFLMLLSVGFGWGKPVNINPSNFRRGKNIQKAEAKVAIAGPIMNFIIAFILLIGFMLLLNFNSDAMLQFAKYQYGASITQMNWTGILTILLYITVVINVGLGVFNLIPIPPLDGSKVLSAFLPYNARQWFYNNEQIFSLIFIVLIITGASTYIISPLINIVFSGMSWLAGLIVGVFI